MRLRKVSVSAGISYFEKSLRGTTTQGIDTQVIRQPNEIMQLNLSPVILLEEMAKNQRDKSDIECKFFENASDVPDPRELPPDKKESYGIRRLTFRKTEQVRSVLHQR